jgi:hypothetical protein
VVDSNNYPALFLAWLWMAVPLVEVDVGVGVAMGVAMDAGVGAMIRNAPGQWAGPGV